MKINFKGNRNRTIAGIILVVGCIVLLLLMVNKCNRKGNDKAVKTTQTALLDTATLIKKDKGGQTFIQATATVTPKIIIKEKLVMVDTASKRYMKELAKLKGVVAATQITMRIKDSTIEVLAEENAYWQWSMYDTTGNFQYTLQMRKDSLTLDSMRLKLKYSYHFAVNTATIKKRNTYTTTFHVDDPNVTLDNSVFVFVPQKTKPGIIFLKWFGVGLSNAASFTGGYYLAKKTK
jgi:hypothetical protein